MNRRTSLAVMAGLGGGTVAIGTKLAFAAKGGGGTSKLAAPVTGSVLDATGTLVGQLAGNITISNFKASGSQLLATGTINATITDLLGNVIDTIKQVVQLIVDLANTSGTCTILTLTLGPLDLNLLGLMIHLNQVVLVITANPAGGLLGQLLCSIANALSGLLSGLTTLTDLATLLNSLLALFSG